MEKRFAVKAQNGKYLIDGEVAPKLELISGKIYEFDLSDASLINHPLKFKVGENIFNGSVRYDGTHGVDQVISLTVPSMTDGVGLMSYYCENHAGMGSDIEIKFNIIFGTDSNNSLTGLSGSDWIEGLQGNDTIDGGAGDDYIDGGDGDDTILGGDGDDIIKAGDGADSVDAGDGDDIVYASHGLDHEDGGDGIDTFIVEEELDYVPMLDLELETAYLLGSEPGTQNTIRNFENVTIISNGSFGIKGDANANVLIADKGDDELHGGGGNDTLHGGEGDDTLDGGSGDDTLAGGAGDDVYEYWGHQGFDIISETSGFDKIIFKDGHQDNAGWGSPFREGNDLVYIAKNELSGFRVQDHFVNPENSIEQFEYEYSGYSVLVRNSDTPIESDTSSELLVGTSQDDTLIGTYSAIGPHTEFYAYDGDDVIDNSNGTKSWIEAGSGDDTLIGGNEEDRMRGQLGNDTLHGNDGNDFLFGGAGNDTLNGDAGDDTLDGGAGDDTLYGGVGDDSLDGGVGSNLAFGGTGDDTYVSTGYGYTEIVDTSGVDTVYLYWNDLDGNFISRNPLRLGNDFVILNTAKSETLRFIDAFVLENPLELVQFYDPSKDYEYYTTGAFTLSLTDQMSDGGDIIYVGSDDAENIDTGDFGNRDIYANGGDDIIDVGDGNRWVFGGSGDDKITVRGSSDTHLFGESGNDTIAGDNGNDYIEGGDGDDTLKVGFGADLVIGGSGEDAIYLSSSETYTRKFSAKNTSSKFQTGTHELINLKDYLKTEDVVDGSQDADTIHLGSGNIALFLHDALSAFHGKTNLTTDAFENQSAQRINNIENIFAYDGDNIIDLTSTDYSLAGETIKVSGGNGNDVIWGSDADEIILGDAGNDILFGGAGENTLFGGEGADEFQFTKTSKNDRIEDFNLTDGDTLKFFNKGGARFDRDSVSLNSAGDELSIAYGSDADDVLTISLTNAGLQLNDLTTDVLIIA